MSWRSWLAVRLQGGRASGVAPTGVDSTDSSWIHARKDNAAPGVPSGDRSGRRGERGSRVLDIRYMLPGRAYGDRPCTLAFLTLHLNYAAASRSSRANHKDRLCSSVSLRLHRSVKQPFSPIRTIMWLSLRTQKNSPSLRGWVNRSHLLQAYAIRLECIPLRAERTQSPRPRSTVRPGNEPH
jgi:hypothetical protein